VVVLFHFEQFCGVFVVGSWSSACGFLSLSAAPSSLSFALQALLVFSYTFFPSLTETLYDSTRILYLQNKWHKYTLCIFSLSLVCLAGLDLSPTYPLQPKKVQNNKRECMSAK